jgi:hypothetical protein
MNIRANQPLPDVAYYYPNPMWSDGEWVKNLVLFFDGIALLLPESMKDRPFEADPAIAYGLADAGLLHILEPEEHVDATVTGDLADAIDRILRSGALDGLTAKPSEFASLSKSRLGYMGDPELAEIIFHDLRDRGLAGDGKRGSVSVHPVVRTLVLVLLAQVLRKRGKILGFEFHPATDRPEIHFSLRELLGAPALPSAGSVVSLDVKTVGIDLGAVPIDEVLDFRRREGPAFQRYARDLRHFVRELSLLPEEERAAAMTERQEALSDAAADLNRKGDLKWRTALGFGLGIAGAAWMVLKQDPVGAALSLAGQLVAGGGQAREAHAYDYLMHARRHLN